jgi:hypothetical protein
MLFEVGYHPVDLKWFALYSGPQVFSFVEASAYRSYIVCASPVTVR